VYKLVAVRQNDSWEPAIKISETAAKTPNPGHKRVWRLYDQRGNATADVLSLDDENPAEMDEILLHHPTEHTAYRTLAREEVSDIEPLLVEILRDGKQVQELPSLEEMRQHRERDLARLDPGVRRLLNPHIYHVSLTPRLWERKQALIKATRQQSQ
jgi:nicotinate phosphoribosyltransferase